VNVYLRLRLTCLLLSVICCRLCLFRVLLDACPFCFLQYTALPAFCNCCLIYLFIYFFTVPMGSGPLPLLDGAFHTTTTVTSFPLSKVAGWLPPLLPSLAGLLIYSLRERLPLLHSLGPGCPALFARCLFFFKFSF
jgi:hypothetical protein